MTVCGIACNTHLFVTEFMTESAENKSECFSSLKISIQAMLQHNKRIGIFVLNNLVAVEKNMAITSGKIHCSIQSFQVGTEMS